MRLDPDCAVWLGWIDCPVVVPLIGQGHVASVEGPVRGRGVEVAVREGGTVPVPRHARAARHPQLTF